MNAIPPPRRPLPTRSTDLAFGGQLTLWALRLWLSANSGCPALHRTLRTGFTQVRLPAAHVALDHFLSIVVYCNCCAFAVSSRSSRELTSDEQLFLSFVADQQEGVMVAAYQKPMNWISPGELRLAMAVSMEYATLLANNNLKALHAVCGNNIQTPAEIFWKDSGPFH